MNIFVCFASATLGDFDVLIPSRFNELKSWANPHLSVGSTSIWTDVSERIFQQEKTRRVQTTKGRYCCQRVNTQQHPAKQHPTIHLTNNIHHEKLAKIILMLLSWCWQKPWSFSKAVIVGTHHLPSRPKLIGHESTWLLFSTKISSIRDWQVQSNCSEYPKTNIVIDIIYLATRRNSAQSKTIHFAHCFKVSGPRVLRAENVQDLQEK